MNQSISHAENSVLGGLMLDRETLPVVSKFICESDFSDTQNRYLFCAIKKVIESGFQADPVSLNEHIKGNGELLQFVATLAATYSD